MKWFLFKELFGLLFLSFLAAIQKGCRTHSNRISRVVASCFQSTQTYLFVTDNQNSSSHAILWAIILPLYAVIVMANSYQNCSEASMLKHLTKRWQIHFR